MLANGWRFGAIVADGTARRFQVFRIVASKFRFFASGYSRTRKKWRRGGDSNPRYGCPYAAFRVRCIQPLCHLSGSRGRRFRRGRCHSGGRRSAQGPGGRNSGLFVLTFGGGLRSPRRLRAGIDPFARQPTMRREVFPGAGRERRTGDPGSSFDNRLTRRRLRRPAPAGPTGKPETNAKGKKCSQSSRQAVSSTAWRPTMC